MISLKVLWYFWCTLQLTVSYDNSNPVIETTYGKVVGTTEYSQNGREYLSFRGIPYAKPPTGELRFKNPERPEPWSTPINATENAPPCIQIDYFFSNPKVRGSEDCLYLNIYVPKIYRNLPFPTMVFIHWGGFLSGRGSSDYLGPEYLMDKDIILVTLNYRLGVFGFFTTLDDNAPGNFGLKDQSLALQFIQENIERFGGVKNGITLSGQSAGAGSVSLHLVSPLSKGLFQQAISLSGSSLDLWAKPLNLLTPNVTSAVGVFTGCEKYLQDSKELVNCIRKVNATALAETAQKFKYFYDEPITPYVVVTETKTDSNPNPFLTKQPLEYFQAGEFRNVPYLVGTTSDEGILRVAPLTRQPEILKELNANFTQLLPQMLVLGASVPQESVSSLLDDIVQFYLGGNYSIDIENPKSVQGFINLYTDRSFLYGIYQGLILQSIKGQSPIWAYNFNYRGQYSYGDLFATTDKDFNFPWGVSHCDDLLYLFKSPALFPELSEVTDLVMRNELLNLVTNFVTYGNPDVASIYNWESLSFENNSSIKNENLAILNITGNYQSGIIEYSIAKGFDSERMAFWRNHNLYENFPGLA